MRLKLRSSQCGESGLLDLFVIIFTLVLIAAIFLPSIAKRNARSSKINCVNNLKQVGLAYRIWAGDNDDKYPAQVSTNAGGTMELIASGLAFPDFVVMSNELGTPKIIVCPADIQRVAGTNFSTLTNANVSYFNVPEAIDTIPELWLAGDRNLATNNTALKPGLFTMPTNRVFSWTAQIHKNKGNICFADASVQQYTSKRLHHSATNSLRAYYEATTNMSFRLLVP